MASITRRSLRSAFRRIPHRAMHTRRGELATPDAQGTIAVIKRVDIYIGEPDDDAYVMVSRRVGKAFLEETTATTAAAEGGCRAETTCALVFDHVEKCFRVRGAEADALPQLRIPIELPRQGGAEDTSRATLFLLGASDTIALNGTADYDFARESAETERRLGLSLDNLSET